MAPGATFKSPLHQMTQTTSTCLWNDSCSLAELGYAIEHGAVGATCNPVIVVEQDVLPAMGAPLESATRNRRYLRQIGL